MAGVAAFFGASTACAAFVNRVSDGIAAQLADFGSDLGLVVTWLGGVWALTTWDGPKTLEIMGLDSDYQPQLVIPGFLNFQQDV